jgi:NTE family protein
MDESFPLGEASLLGGLAPHVQQALLAVAEEVRLPAQEWLFREGDAADRLFFVVSGRLRVVVEHDGQVRVARLLGPGAAIGELAVLAGTARSASAQAVRDSELLEIEGDRFLELLARDQELSVGLARALARQLQQSGGLTEQDARPTVFTVAPAPGADARSFWGELCTAFAALGPTAAVERPSGDAWGRELADLEARNAFVLLLARPDDAEWNSFCLRQADRVLLVATGTPPEGPHAPEVSDVAFLGTPAAQTVAAWRAATTPRTHHVVPADDDLAAHRVARRLTGRSLGLVLSGGGARAFAHLGVLEVLAERGLVVDRVGGTSMGAFVAAMVAVGWTPERMLDVCRTEVMQRAPFSDYTLPRHALIRARRAESMLRRLFGDAAVEELARPLFTVSADLLSGQMVVHRDGPLVEAVGASMAIPGLAPPVSYRAQLLVDGGILNNLPIDLMIADEPGPVVAVDVMRQIASDEPNANARTPLPTILETLSRATVLGSVQRAETNRGLAAILVTPDVQHIALRDFRHLDRAIEAGRLAAEEALATVSKGELADAVAPPTALRTPTYFTSSG